MTSSFMQLFHTVINHSCDVGMNSSLTLKHSLPPAHLNRYRSAKTILFRYDPGALHRVHNSVLQDEKGKELRWLLALYMSDPFGREYCARFLVVR